MRVQRGRFGEACLGLSQTTHADTMDRDGSQGYASIQAMQSSQVDRPTHEYDLYLMLFITSSGGW